MANNFDVDDNFDVHDDIGTKLTKLNKKLLKTTCNDFIITFTTDQSYNMELSLKNIKDDNIVSNIHIIRATANMVYINIYTLPEYENKGFITFLMAVLVFIGNSIYIGEGFKLTFIGLHAHNPISALIVIKHFETSSIKSVETKEEELSKNNAMEIIMNQLEKQKQEEEYSEEYDEDKCGEDKLIVVFNIYDNIQNAITLIKRFFSSRNRDILCNSKIERKRKTDQLGGVRSSIKNKRKLTRKSRKSRRRSRKGKRKTRK